MVTQFSDEFRLSNGLDVRLRFEDKYLSDFVFSKVDEDVKAFISKFSKQFSNVFADIGMKKLNMRLKGIPEYECKINLITDKGSFYAKETGIGALQAVSECLSDLEIQIEKKIRRRLTRNPTRGNDPYQMTKFEEN